MHKPAGVFTSPFLLISCPVLNLNRKIFGTILIFAMPSFQYLKIPYLKAMALINGLHQNQYEKIIPGMDHDIDYPFTRHAGSPFPN